MESNKIDERKEMISVVLLFKVRVCDLVPRDFLRGGETPWERGWHVCCAGTLPRVSRSHLLSQSTPKTFNNVHFIVCLPQFRFVWKYLELTDKCP